MRSRIAVVAGAALLAIATHATGQTTTQTKTPEAGIQVSTETLTGEVVATADNMLVAKLRPNGNLRLFNVPPGARFVIDGKPMLIGELKPGTVLTAKTVTKTQPITVRTTTVTNGTVWYVSGNYLIATLANGDNRDYKVPDGYKFTVDGRQLGVNELRKGMKLSGTKIVEEPHTEMSVETAVTGTAPK